MPPAQLHEQSEKPYAITLQPEDYSYLFGIKKPLNQQAGLIKTDINSITYYYWIQDYEIISKHGRVLCCFNYNDLSTVDLYAVTAYDEVPVALRDAKAAPPIRQYLGRALQGDAAQPYGPQANWELINRRRRIIEENREYAEQEYAAATGTYDLVDEVSLLTPAAIPKATYEAAETAYLSKAPKNVAMSPAIRHVARNIKESLDETDNFFNPQNQY